MCDYNPFVLTDFESICQDSLEDEQYVSEHLIHFSEHMETPMSFPHSAHDSQLQGQTPNGKGQGQSPSEEQDTYDLLIPAADGKPEKAKKVLESSEKTTEKFTEQNQAEVSAEKSKEKTAESQENKLEQNLEKERNKFDFKDPKNEDVTKSKESQESRSLNDSQDADKNHKSKECCDSRTEHLEITQKELNTVDLAQNGSTYDRNYQNNLSEKEAKEDEDEGENSAETTNENFVDKSKGSNQQTTEEKIENGYGNLEKGDKSNKIVEENGEDNQNRQKEAEEGEIVVVELSEKQTNRDDGNNYYEDDYEDDLEIDRELEIDLTEIDLSSFGSQPTASLTPDSNSSELPIEVYEIV